MMIRKHYGINDEDKRMIVEELVKTDALGDQYDHIVPSIGEIAGVDTDISDIWFRVFINDNGEELSDLTTDEIADNCDIEIVIRGCNGHLAGEILSAYKTGTSISDVDEDGEFNIFLNEKSPLYYDLLKEYMVDRGYDWKWGEPSKCSIEHV